MVQITYTATFEYLPRGEDLLTNKAKLSATADTRSEAKALVLNRAKAAFKQGYKITESYTFPANA